MHRPVQDERQFDKLSEEDFPSFARQESRGVAYTCSIPPVVQRSFGFR